MVLKNDVYPTGYRTQDYASQQAGYVPSNGGYQNCVPGVNAPGGYGATYPQHNGYSSGQPAPQHGYSSGQPAPQHGYSSGPSGAYGTHPHGHSHGHGHGHGHGPTPHGHGYGSNYGPAPTYGQQYPGAGYHSVKDIDDEE